MVLNDIMLDSQISVFFSDHQRNFLVHQTGTSTETHSRRLCLTLSSKWDVSIKSLHSWFRETCKRGSRKNVRFRGNKGNIKKTNKQTKTRSSKNCGTHTHMNSQRLRQHVQDLGRSASDKVLELEREVITYLHPRSSL